MVNELVAKSRLWTSTDRKLLLTNDVLGFRSKLGIIESEDCELSCKTALRGAAISFSLVFNIGVD